MSPSRSTRFRRRRGVYVRARIYKKSFEALYVGKADRTVRSRDEEQALVMHCSR